MIEASAYEKLGVFYLGQPMARPDGEPAPQPFLYDAKDLTTHAFCVGMTGSGKTGLCVTLLEEAALDGIPAIAIDPKGDLGNLLLTFPELRAADFRPWIDETDAARNDRSPDEQAEWTAALWARGLANSGQDGARIGRFRSAVEATIYTPGSRIGRPLKVLGSLEAPSPDARSNPDDLRDRAAGTVSGLLALVGIDADPLQSREHILLARILTDSWEKGVDLELGSLIQAVQTPPFEKVGVLDLESYFPAKERFKLAMTLNNLLGSPGFEAWMEGDSLDVQRLLYTKDGKPRLSILSIAHLSEQERMFFVTVLLGEVISWMRSQEGTGSLRALLFMDEVYGYFPPLGNPPAKPLMLTLLKQARAYGVGVVLATQNPVDIDYKGLSNCGTWFLGRLQTERDKARVLEGLEGVAQAGFDRSRMDQLLSTLGKRVFLMNNVHDDVPSLFTTRWALSYLRGPLGRQEIERLSSPEPELARPTESAPPASQPTQASTAEPPETPGDGDDGQKPLLPQEANECFVASAHAQPDGGILYEPGLLAEVDLHYVRRRGDVDHWQAISLYTTLEPSGRGSPWTKNTEAGTAKVTELAPGPLPGAHFAKAPAAASNPRSYARWTKMLVSYLYKENPLLIWHCRDLKMFSTPGESEGDFRVRLQQRLRERRDEKRAALEKRFAPKFKRLADRKRSAESRVERERSQYDDSKTDTIISLGSTLLGALMGRRRSAISTGSRAARGVSRASKERKDIARAQAQVEAIDEKIADLDQQYRDELASIVASPDQRLQLEELPIRPRRADINVNHLRFAWRPR